jgi:hypothetical protein
VFSTRFAHLLSTIRGNSPMAQTIRSMAEISANLLTKASLSSLDLSILPEFPRF